MFHAYSNEYDLHSAYLKITTRHKKSELSDVFLGFVLTILIFYLHEKYPGKLNFQISKLYIKKGARKTPDIPTKIDGYGFHVRKCFINNQ